MAWDLLDSVTMTSHYAIHIIMAHGRGYQTVWIPADSVAQALAIARVQHLSDPAVARIVYAGVSSRQR